MRNFAFLHYKSEKEIMIMIKCENGLVTIRGEKRILLQNIWLSQEK